MKEWQHSMRELKEEFRQEALEHLSAVEKELIFIEKAPDPERIANIFRSIHSIKGGAGFMGYEHMMALSHGMETLLQTLRQGNVKPDREIIDVLLAGTDMIRKMLDGEEGGNGMEISGISDRLSHLISTGCNPGTLEKMGRPLSLFDEEEKDSGFTVNQFRLDSLPEDHHLFHLRFNLNHLQQKRSIPPLKLIRDLLQQGFILETRIETGADDFDGDLLDAALLYHILFATPLSEAGIQERWGPEILTRVHSKGDSAPVCQPAGQPVPTGSAEDPNRPSASGQTALSPEASACVSSLEHQDTVRIRVEILDKLMKLAGELVQVRNNLLAMTAADSLYRGVSQRLDIVTTEMQETIMQTRLQPIGYLFDRLPRIVRDLRAKLDKRIEIETIGGDVELDKTILESLTDPLIHLVRNCCDHGIEAPKIRRQKGKTETGKIRVRAWHEAGQINIEIADDGAGIDADAVREKAISEGIKGADLLSKMKDRELFDLILISGFSTVEQISDVSGRGVGMDVVRSGVERLGGGIEIDSEKEKGTRVHLRLPLTLAIIPCLLVSVGENRYAIPQSNLVELVSLRDKEIDTRIEIAGDQEVFRLRDRLLPLVQLAEVLQRPEPFTKETRAKICIERGQKVKREEAYAPADFSLLQKSLTFAVVKIGSRGYGLVVGRVLGVEEIVVNPIHSALKSLAIYAGTTIMGDGTVALILDIEGIARHADVQFNRREAETEISDARGEERQTVLLFKSGPQEQYAVPLPMIRRVEPIGGRDIERIGDREFVTVDDVPHRVVRLESVLHVSPCQEAENMLLLLPKHIRRPFGILVSSVVDTLTTTLRLNTQSHTEDGLLGTAILLNRITLFLDIFKLIERAEPDWFEERKKSAPRPREQKKILLLEDTPFFRNLVRGYLESDGYKVTAVENGQEGMDAVKRERFDLIVSDIDMPVMNGWAFMEYVRKESAQPRIPALALTALDGEEDQERAKEAGFNGYQIKLDREALLQDIARLIQRPEEVS